MIFKTASPISPDVEIGIDSVPVNYLSIQRISIEEKENQHTLMVLDFSGLDPEVITYYVDKPVRVSIEFPDLGGIEFLGYVTFLEPQSVTQDGLVNSSPFQLTRVYCLGASYKMKSKKSRAWENVTLADVAKTIVDDYKFSLSVPNDTYRFPRLTQSNQSDWSFIVSTANRLGYSVNLTGTHLHIWDPFKALGRKSSFAILKTIKGMNGNVSPDVGQVLRFEGRVGAVTTSGQRTPETVHTLDDNGNILSVTGALDSDSSGLGTDISSMFSDTAAINANSYEMARKLVTGALRNKFSLTAQVDITGNPTIKPGGIVQLEKYESKFDGYWYVRGARHEITRSELISILDIAKDGTNDDEPQLSHVDAYLSPPASSIINGHWVSEREWVNVYN